MLNLKLTGCLLYTRQCAGPKGDRDERLSGRWVINDHLVQHAQKRLWGHKWGTSDSDRGLKGFPKEVPQA